MDYRDYLKSENVTFIAAKQMFSPTKLGGGGFSCNPYVGCTHNCLYCYARYMPRAAESVGPWGHFLQVKQWNSLPEPSALAAKRVIIGTMTDPYNHLEPFFHTTRKMLEYLATTGAFVTINTKSPLVLGDLDLLCEMGGVTVCFTVNCVDEWFREIIEAAPSTRERIAAMEKLHDAGVRVGCYIAPAMPGITDVGVILKEVTGKCDFVWVDPLNFRSGGYGLFTGTLSVEASHLLPVYKEIYGRKNYTHWKKNSAALRSYCEKHGYIYTTQSEQGIISSRGKPVIVDGIPASLSQGLI